MEGLVSDITGRVSAVATEPALLTMELKNFPMPLLQSPRQASAALALVAITRLSDDLRTVLLALLLYMYVCMCTMYY